MVIQIPRRDLLNKKKTIGLPTYSCEYYYLKLSQYQRWVTKIKEFKQDYTEKSRRIITAFIRINPLTGAN